MAEQDQDNRTRNLQGAIEDLEKEILETQAEKQGDDFGDIVPWVIEFRVVGTPDIIRSPIGETLLFGRLDTAREIFPEIDLSKYSGQQYGVSRRHARLIARDNRVTIEDVGSSNGTYINGQRIPQHHPHRIREGDILQFGNLKLQVHFVVKPSTEDSTMHGLGNEVLIPRVGQGQRLLILDDNKDVCQILRFVSVRSGFEPVIVHSLRDAISVIDTQRVDGVIVEVMLLDGSGLDLVPYIRQKKGKKAVPIIATGNATGFGEGQALQKGASLFLAKPIAIDDLVAALGQLLELMPK
jgi:pSer/pThr/pTyr-binding forkhead associated (FHA) protein